MDKDLLHILLPTRGRPDKLLGALVSIEETARDRNRIVVHLFIDEDDHVTMKAVESIPRNRFGFSITTRIGERTISQGEMVNALWRHSHNRNGIFGCFVDDCRFATKNWDEIIRAAFHEHEDGILLAFPRDPTAAENQVTLAFLSSAWLDTLGHFLTDYFPFWFDDTWLGEVSEMLGRKRRVDVLIDPQGGKGKTPRMKNLPFWHRFYICTADERLQDAKLLREKMFRPGSDEYKANEKEGLRVYESLININRGLPGRQQVRFERAFSEPATFRNEANRIRYLLSESRAINHLLLKAVKYNLEGNISKVAEIMDALKYSSIQSASDHKNWQKQNVSLISKITDRFRNT